MVQVLQNKKEAFYKLSDQGFAEQARGFCLDFATELYRHKVLVASYSPGSQYGPTRRSTQEAKAAQKVWRRFLDTDDSSQEFLRRSSPLLRVGQAYCFLHKSLRDFAIAQSMLQDQPFNAPDSLFNEFHIVEDHGIIDFIFEEAEGNQGLQAQLLTCVEESKRNPKVANAAANAITILVRAGERFQGCDLRGIRIPGADIRSGWFEGAQLQNADLSRARLDRIWLRGADLTDACIEGGEYGEKPDFKLKSPLACFYTPDGELLVASANGNNVQVWSASNRKLLHEFRGYTGSVRHAAFPPSGNHDLLASAGRDHTVRLWSRQNKDSQLVHTFRDCGKLLNQCTIAFSPDAKSLAAGCYKGVCLWSVATLNLIHRFSFDEGSVSSIAFSPDGRTLASAIYRAQINLWSTESGELL